MAGAGAVDADQQPRAPAGGDLRIAAASTAMWSAASLDPALPGRSSIASDSAVFASHAPSGWKP